MRGRGHGRADARSPRPTLPGRRTLWALLLAATASVPAAPPAAERGGTARPALDVPYEPSAPEIVDAMLRLAGVGPGDVVYDLGCGDGRIVVAAARLGARAVGVELDPERVREARANARAAGVADRVEIRQGDLFAADLSAATVVALYLWPEVNLRLRPKLLAELRPGTRVVSHAHDMGDWPPRETAVVGGARVLLWIVPGRAAR